MKKHIKFLKFSTVFEEKAEFNPFVSIKEVKRSIEGKRCRFEDFWNTTTFSYLDYIFDSQDIIEVRSGYEYNTEIETQPISFSNTTSYTVSSPLLEDPYVRVNWFYSDY